MELLDSPQTPMRAWEWNCGQKRGEALSPVGRIAFSKRQGIFSFVFAVLEASFFLYATDCVIDSGSFLERHSSILVELILVFFPVGAVQGLAQLVQGGIVFAFWHPRAPRDLVSLSSMSVATVVSRIVGGLEAVEAWIGHCSDWAFVYGGQPLSR